MPSMKRREFLLALGGAVTAWPLVTHAERRGKPARIGYLSASSPPDSNFESFLAGMRALGYGEGRDFVIEVRYAGRDYTRFPALLEELLRARVDVIVAAPRFGPPRSRPYRFRWCSASAAIQSTPASSRASRAPAGTSRALRSCRSIFPLNASICSRKPCRA